MKAAHQRILLRWLHLLGGVAIGIYIYAPWKEIIWFTLLMQVLIIPSLTFTGLWMWLGPRLKKKLDKLLIVKTEEVVNGKIQKVNSSKYQSLTK